ncbi:MAG: tRNA pseudouridine(13) synthase TruD [archaeon]
MDDDSALLTEKGMNGILSSDTCENKPFLTELLPGTGGEIKTSPEDFFVEEIPAFPFSGEGEHLILLVEKRGLTTHRAAEILAGTAGVSSEKVGYAGLKDAFALTRQFFSVQTPGGPPETAAPGLRIVSATRHAHKLRAGMLSGNRFKIRIRNVRAPGNAAAILEVLGSRGLPNYYGSQRFGSMRSVSAKVGFALLRGDFELAVREYLSVSGAQEPDKTRSARSLCSEGNFSEAARTFPPGCFYELRLISLLEALGNPESAFRRTFPKHLLRLFVSATQSEVFNKILSERIRSIDSFIDGDVGMFEKGAVFFRHAVPEDPRLKTFEVSPSGVLVGNKAILAEGAAGEIERRAISSTGFSESESFPKSRLPFRLDGSRRRLRERISEASISAAPDGTEDILISFVLPKGTYATEVLREVTKTA